MLTVKSSSTKGLLESGMLGSMHVCRNTMLPLWSKALQISKWETPNP